MLKPFFVWQDKKLRKIDPADVICLSTEKNYTKIYLRDKTFYMVRSALSNALEKLPPEMFIKIHRSFAVSVHYIDVIFKDHLLLGDESLPFPIAKPYYQSLMERLNIID